MSAPSPRSPKIRAIIQKALSEDLPNGDATTEALFPNAVFAQAQVVANEAMTLAGIAIAHQVFREIDDFPIKGIGFKDITAILLDPYLCNALVEEYARRLKQQDIIPDVVVGIESRGFLFGIPLAQKFNAPFIPVRKEGKLPGETVSVSYELEYGEATMEMHKNDLPAGSKVLIHDDLLATGGTACAAAELIERQGAEVVAYTFIIALDFLNGRNVLKRYCENIIAIANYK